MLSTKQPSVLMVVVEDSDEDIDTVVEAVKQSRVTTEVRRATTGLRWDVKKLVLYCGIEVRFFVPLYGSNLAKRRVES